MRPRSAYAFAHIDRWARLASIAPRLVNLTTQLPGLRAVAKWAAGMPQQRSIPVFAPQTFRTWFETRTSTNPKRDTGPALAGYFQQLLPPRYRQGRG